MDIEEYNRYILLKFQEKLDINVLPRWLRDRIYYQLQMSLKEAVEFKNLVEKARTLEKK